MIGFRPLAAGAQTDSTVDFKFTASIALETCDTGTRYIATVRHGDEAARKQHEAMGFYEGWGIALDQLLVYVKTMKG